MNKSVTSHLTSGSITWSGEAELVVKVIKKRWKVDFMVTDTQLYLSIPS